jgi:hypothetical protein
MIKENRKKSREGKTIAGDREVIQGERRERGDMEKGYTEVGEKRGRGDREGDMEKED